MSFVASWRTALRVARREARRSKGRSALVIAMIAMPVLCLSFAAVTYDMFTLSPTEVADRTMGMGDARISWTSHLPHQQDPSGGDYGSVPYTTEPTPDQSKPGSTAELSTVLPSGTTVLPVRKGVDTVKTVDGIGRLNAIAVDATNPMVTGYLTITAGRAPTAANEVALSTQAVARLGAGLGGTVTSADQLETYTVVGLVEFPSQLEQTMLFAPIVGDPPKSFEFQDDTWLVDTPSPIDWSQVRQLNQRGMLVTSRETLLHPPTTDLYQAPATSTIPVQDLAIGTLVAGLALLEIVLLAGPAFAVSARRRHRQLALVAANGGTPAHVRRIVLADGVVLGMVGAGVGIGLGVVGAFAARPLVEQYATHFRGGAYRIFPVALIAIASLAVITGVLAALVPAFITARQNVITALAGRRGVTRSKKRWLILGLVMVAVGATIVIAGTTQVSAQIMLAGLVIGELGLVLCTPSLVGLIARIGRILPVAPRIALRDAARNRAAAAPAISAVMAAVAGSVAVGLYFESDRVQQSQQYILQAPVGSAVMYLGGAKDPESTTSPPSPAQYEATARATLPVSDVRVISTADCASQQDKTVIEFSGNGPADVKQAPATYHVCAPQFLVDPAQQCAQESIIRHRELTKAEARAANADPRCKDAFFRGGGVFGGVTVDDGSALAIMTGASAADVAGATAVLKAGGVVVTDKRFITNGTATLAVVEFDMKTDGTDSGNPDDHLADARKITLPAYLLTTGVNGAGPVISAAAAAKAQLAVSQTGMIASTSRYPTQAEEDRFHQQLEKLKQYGMIVAPPQYQRDAMLWIIMGAAALITLGAAGIGTGLAAADGRADLSTLASVGASPRLRRGLSLSQSGVIAGVGSLLGAGAGLGAAMAVLVALNQRYLDIWPGPTQFPLTVPWLSLGVALLLVPALAMAGAGLLTRSRLPIERRT